VRHWVYPPERSKSLGLHNTCVAWLPTSDLAAKPAEVELDFVLHHHDAALHRNASLSPLLLGCIALSGLCTRCANCGFTPIGAEISISRPWALTGSLGPTLWRLRPMKEKPCFLVQSVAREYLLDGEFASFTGDAMGELLWYDGSNDWRRSEVKMWKGLLDFDGVVGVRM